MAAGFAVSLGEQYAPESHLDSSQVMGQVWLSTSAPGDPETVPADYGSDAPQACHCLHVHALWAGAQALPTILAMPERADRTPDPTASPRSVEIPRHFRPPIV